MKKICLSIDQMQKLKKLGVETKDASMCWVRDPEGNYSFSLHDESCYEMSFMNPVPAFTLQDMLEMMPRFIETEDYEYELNIYFHESGVSIFYDDGDISPLSFFSELTILASAYEMLVWLAGNGYLKGGNK